MNVQMPLKKEKKRLMTLKNINGSSIKKYTKKSVGRPEEL